jgi:hypothetical protein
MYSTISDLRALSIFTRQQDIDIHLKKEVGCYRPLVRIVDGTNSFTLFSGVEAQSVEECIADVAHILTSALTIGRKSLPTFLSALTEERISEITLALKVENGNARRTS